MGLLPVETEISIIYANRNRDVARIITSLNSLKNQIHKNFEVIFIDYGSSQKFIQEYKNLENTFNFLKAYFLPVSHLLWNKSKALNFGIKQASSPFIFIADVDLIFHPRVTTILEEIKSHRKFFLFKLGYLGRVESEKLLLKYDFDKLEPERFGAVNGMVLASKEALINVHGLDEFFHFYGAEDEDLFSRLENAGYERQIFRDHYFYHNWHQSFSGSEDNLLTRNPRLKNIMRINQRHHLNSHEIRIIKPRRQTGMGEIRSQESSKILDKPTKYFRVMNILAHVEHCLREEIPSYTGEVVKVDFIEDPYYSTWKYKLKNLLGKQTQLYCTMKDVNDMLLKEILFLYRDENYSFEISEDLKTISFCIAL